MCFYKVLVVELLGWLIHKKMMINASTLLNTTTKMMLHLHCHYEAPNHTPASKDFWNFFGGNISSTHFHKITIQVIERQYIYLLNDGNIYLKWYKICNFYIDIKGMKMTIISSPRHKITCIVNLTFKKKQDEGLHDL